MAMSTNERTNEPTHERVDGGAELERSSTHAQPPAPQHDPAASATLPVVSEPAASPINSEPDAAAPPTTAPAAFTARAALAARHGLRYAKRHPFRAIAAAAAAGALIEVEVAVTLGVLAGATVLLMMPNGAARRRELQRRLQQRGKEAVTAIREAFRSGPSAPPPRE